MEKKEKKRLEESLSLVLNNQEILLKKRFETYCDEETLLKYAITPNVLLMSDTGGYTAYIGTNGDCNFLKSKFSGKVGLSGNVWYWVGIAPLEKIKSILVGKRQYFTRVVKKLDFLDAVLLFTQVLSKDILCESQKSKVKAYVGAYRLAKELKRKFGGKSGYTNQTYYWIGEADRVDVFNVYNSYKRQGKHFNRKKLLAF